MLLTYIFAAFIAFIGIGLTLLYNAKQNEKVRAESQYLKRINELNKENDQKIELNLRHTFKVTTHSERLFTLFESDKYLGRYFQQRTPTEYLWHLNLLSHKESWYKRRYKVIADDLANDDREKGGFKTREDRLCERARWKCPKGVVKTIDLTGIQSKNQSNAKETMRFYQFKGFRTIHLETMDRNEDKQKKDVKTS